MFSWFSAPSSKEKNTPGECPLKKDSQIDSQPIYLDNSREAEEPQELDFGERINQWYFSLIKGAVPESPSENNLSIEEIQRLKSPTITPLDGPTALLTGELTSSKDDCVTCKWSSSLEKYYHRVFAKKIEKEEEAKSNEDGLLKTRSVVLDCGTVLPPSRKSEARIKFDPAEAEVLLNAYPRTDMGSWKK